VALDTAGFSINTARLYAKGSIGNFAYKFYLQNIQQLKNYKAPGDFVKTFSFTEDNWKEFVTAAAKDSITLTSVTAKERADIVNRIKSSIARQVWRTEGMVEVLNTDDNTLKKALELFQK